MHSIRKLRELGNATVADYEKILAPNVVFHSPVLIRTAEGREVVAKIFATSTTLREGVYTGEWKLDDRRTLLRWKGVIQGHELESFDLIEENDEGLIVDRTIAFRPMPQRGSFETRCGLPAHGEHEKLTGKHDETWPIGTPNSGDQSPDEHSQFCVIAIATIPKACDCGRSRRGNRFDWRAEQYRPFAPVQIRYRLMRC